MLVAAVLIGSRIQIEADDGVGSRFESGEPFELFSQRHTPPHPLLAREFTANRVPARQSFWGAAVPCGIPRCSRSAAPSRLPSQLRRAGSLGVPFEGLGFHADSRCSPLV